MQRQSAEHKQPDEARSRTMRAVKGQNTKPEMKVRRITHAMGYRYRLHRKDLPGKPDLVFPGRRKIIFVHGCFWHGHDCPRGARTPKTNREYWQAKIARNVERDTQHLSALKETGWQVMPLWECELKDNSVIEEKIRRFLER